MAATVLLLSPRLAVAPLRPHPRLGLTPTAVGRPLPLAYLGCRAAAARQLAAVADRNVYNGVYGPWTVEDADVREVLLYRSGLVTAAASFVAAASAAFLPEGNAAGDAIRQGIDLLYATGAAGLGLSLVLIHIYVTPIKRFLQALWVVGVIGSIGTYVAGAQPLDDSLVSYVLDHPAALWFVGPTFAALTGLVFKEGTVQLHCAYYYQIGTTIKNRFNRRIQFIVAAELFPS